MSRRIAAVLLIATLCAGVLIPADASGTKVSAQYDEGVVTVSAEGLEAGTRYDIISIQDAEGLLKALGIGGEADAGGKLGPVAVTTGKLEQGEYTVRIFQNRDGQPLATGVFTVTGEKPNPPAPSGSGGSAYVSGKKPQVTQEGHGTVAVSADGKTVSITPADGYEIADVQIDGKSVGAVGEYTFDTASSSHTVHVVFIKNQTDAASESQRFTDLEDHWAKEAILAAADAGLFNGTSAQTFSPDSSMTRGMVVTVLARMAKAETTGAASKFTDVAAGAWYAPGVAWASENGIVTGVGRGRFAPDTAVTREQLCTMLARYAAFAKLSLARGTDWAAADSESVSTWAEDAVDSLKACGVLAGKPGNRIDPQGLATRAEVAVVLQRFAEAAKQPA